MPSIVSAAGNAAASPKARSSVSTATSCPRPAWRRAVVPAVLVLVVTSFGSAAAALGFSLSPQVSAPPVAYPAWWPPLSLFWAVWLVIYPCSALALWHVWRRRHDADVRGALTAFVVLDVSSALLLPVSALVGDAAAAGDLVLVRALSRALTDLLGDESETP